MTCGPDCNGTLPWRWRRPALRLRAELLVRLGCVAMMHDLQISQENASQAAQSGGKKKNHLSDPLFRSKLQDALQKYYKETEQMMKTYENVT